MKHILIGSDRSIDRKLTQTLDSGVHHFRTITQNEKNKNLVDNASMYESA